MDTHRHQKRQTIVGWLLTILLLSISPAQAREFRDIKPIAVPTQAVETQAAQVFKPVERELVEQAVDEIFSSYNTPQMASVLGDDFYDKSRLLDAVNEQVPRDAQLRVLAVRAVNTLSQEVRSDPAGGPDRLVSTVTVTVRAQMEFNDSTGFQRREGTNELTLRINQPMKP